MKSHAGCQACWTMHYVEIETIDGDIIQGYVKWNSEWYVNLEDTEIEIPQTFPEDFMKYYQNWLDGADYLNVYRNFHKIGENEDWSGYVLTNNDFFTIGFYEIKNMKELDNPEFHVSGAQELKILTQENLKLFESKPFHVEMFNDGCEIYFLNFNKDLTEVEFKKIVSDHMIKTPQKLSENLILTISYCYD
jgi:hypothetical protein